MRAFLAFPVPKSAADRIWSACAHLHVRPLPVKWVRPENLHITLHFLGEINGKTAGMVSETLHSGALMRAPFPVGYRGIAGFPKGGPWRVLTLDLLDGAEECAGYYRKLGELLSAVRAATSRKFTPHITVGRVRRGSGNGRVDLSKEEESLGGHFAVSRCVFYESLLRPGGPEYHEITSVDFETKSGE